MKLYNEFINIAKTLNKELDITPLLYGSLGLEKVTGLNFSPEDIDILIPLIFLEEKWKNLKKLWNCKDINWLIYMSMNLGKLILK